MNWTDVATLVTILAGSVGINIYLFSSFQTKMEHMINVRFDAFEKRLDAMEKRITIESKRIDTVFETLINHLNK